LMAIVYFSNDTDFNVSEYKPILKGIIDESLKVIQAPAPAPEVSVLFVGNETIHTMNNRYRHIDGCTDVLSFPMYDSWKEWPLMGQAFAAGDIVISVEQALAQSEAYGHSLAREMGFLTAHSMLHLMGYDHLTPETEKEMYDLQDKILIKSGLLR